MAKYDVQSNRHGAGLEEEPLQDIFRAAVSAPRRAAAPVAADARLKQPAPFSDMAPGRSDDGEEGAFLRTRRRVPIRRGILPQSRAAQIGLAAGCVLLLAAAILLGISVRAFLKNDPRFRIDSSSSIRIIGNSQITRPQLLSVFGSDIGRNIFFVPLKERRAAVEQLPWVAHATVMRLLPNQLRIAIVERTPVAFVRDGNKIGLVDAHGVLLDMSPRVMEMKHYSFPVLTGIRSGDPLSQRAARMRLYQQFIAELDSNGQNISQQLSEVDLSDPEDIRALMPAHGSSVLAHFGEGSFLDRYERYRDHIAEWQRQYPHLASADLRYDDNVVLGMAQGASVKAADGSSGAPFKEDATSPRENDGAREIKPDPASSAVPAARHAAVLKSARSTQKPLKTTSKATARAVHGKPENHGPAGRPETKKAQTKKPDTKRPEIRSRYEPEQ